MATIGDNYSFTPSGSDSTNESLTYSITNKPSWATFDSATGTLSGTPSQSDIGVYPVEITVNDGNYGGDDTISFSIGVNRSLGDEITHTLGATGLDQIESSVKLWLNGFNIDGNNNTTLEKNDLVGKWVDLSGNSNHAIKPSNDHRPLFSTDAWVQSKWRLREGIL